MVVVVVVVVVVSEHSGGSWASLLERGLGKSGSVDSERSSSVVPRGAGTGRCGDSDG